MSRTFPIPAGRRAACALLACALLGGVAAQGPTALRAVSGWVPGPAGDASARPSWPGTVATMGIRN